MKMSNDFDRELQVLKFGGENYYLPSMIFCKEKSLFKIVFGQIFFNCHPIFKLFVAHFRTN